MRWFSPETPVSSTTNNYLILCYAAIGQKKWQSNKIQIPNFLDCTLGFIVKILILLFLGEFDEQHRWSASPGHVQR